MSENEPEDGVQDIDLDDLPTTIEKPKRNPLDCLPSNLRTLAQKLPVGEQHTVLELPSEGAGHNNGLLYVARICYEMGVSFEDTINHLANIYDSNRLDYETAPQRAVERVWEAEGDLTKIVDGENAAPKAKQELLLRFRRMKSVGFTKASPGDIKTKTADILEAIFEPKEIINIQFTAMEAGTLTETQKLGQLLQDKDCRLDKFKFLNPSVFKKVEGSPNTRNKNKITTRCNDNVKKRHFMVLEFDPSKEEKDPDAVVERFNNFAWTMSQFAPLVMVVDTGGKSVHFWFDAREASNKQRQAFFAHACLHGADPRLAVKSQIARMPNVSAAKEGRGEQKVLYYDPKGANFPEDGWNIKGFEEYLNEARQLNYYYNGGEGERYYTQDNEGRWFCMNRTSVLVDLAIKGYRKQIADGETVTPAEHVTNTIQRDRNLSGVVKACAGRHAGFYEENGERFLVTASPTLIKGRKGPWPTIKKFLNGFMRDQDQCGHLLTMLSAMVLDMRNNDSRIAGFSQIQMLHFCGPRNSGKTLFKDCLLTPLMGGRQACADAYFKQNPDLHNAEIFAAEVIYLDDTAILQTNYQARQEHGERIKTLVVGGGLGGQRSMRQDRLAVRSLNRPFRFLNEEAQTLATLPLLDDGVEDKWVLYWTQELNAYWPECEQPGWFELIAGKFQEELPGFIYYLMFEHNVSEQDKCPLGRYPAKSFKHPEIMNLMAEGSAEHYLLYRMDNDCKLAIFGDAFDDGAPLTPWRGSADSLYDIMAATGSRAMQNRFQKLCPNSKVMLAQLRQLEKDTERIVYSDRCDEIPNTYRRCKYWQIYPPQDGIETANDTFDNNDTFDELM